MKTHIKALSAILCFALLTACGEAPEISDVSAASEAATIAVQTEEELIEPEIVIETRATAMEVTEAPIEPPAAFSDEDYIKSVNSAMFGQVAFDDDGIYYISRDELNGTMVFKQEYDVSMRSYFVAAGNEYGFLHSLQIKGDELYYVSRYNTENDIEGTEGATSACLYAVPTDFTEDVSLRTVIEGVGDYYFFDGDNIIYSGDSEHGNGGTFIYNTLTGEQTEIDAGGAHLSYADGELLYDTGKELGIYDIAAGKTTWSIPTPGTGVQAMVRYENKLIYSYRYSSENTKTLTGIAYYDIDTKEHVTVYEAVSDKNIPESESPEDYIPNADNQWVSDGFTIYDGKLVFYGYEATYYPYFDYDMLLREYFNEATLYSYDFETEKTEILVPKTYSKSAYAVTSPQSAIYSTPGGIYCYEDARGVGKIYE
jgi:hypothetical protein